MGVPTVGLRPGGLRWVDGIRPAALGWLAARAAVALGYLLARALSGRVDLPDGRLHIEQGLMTWDGTFYRVITEGWYSGAGTAEDPSRFFPGYPAVARAVRPLVLGDTDLALLLVANGAALAAAVLLWRLAAEVTGDRGTATRVAWMAAVVPAANVAAFAYTESLMLLLVAVVLLALHRRRPGWAAAAGLCAGLLRPQGILLVVPVAVEAWRWWRAGGTHRAREVAGWAAALLAPAAGLAAALWAVSRGSGDLLEAYRIQRAIRGGFQDPVTRLGEAVVDVARGDLHDVYNLAFALGFAALFVVAWRRRQPASWLAYLAVTWVVAVGGQLMDSVGRYCWVAAPFAIALAQWAASRRRQVVVAVVGLGGTVWFTTEVFLGRVIP